jgi:hypothetical protein
MSSVGHIVKGGFSKFFFQFLSDGLGSFWTKQCEIGEFSKCPTKDYYRIEKIKQDRKNKGKETRDYR